MSDSTEKQYKVFGGYLTDDFDTTDYNEAFENFLKRVKLTKPETDARIGMVSAWHDKDGNLKINTDAFVILASPETLRILNSYNKYKRIKKKVEDEHPELAYIDDSEMYYKLKYE